MPPALQSPSLSQRRGTSNSSNSNSAAQSLVRNATSKCMHVLLFFAACVGLYQLAWQYWLAGYNVPDVDIDPVTGKERIRRRPDKLKKYDADAGKHVPTSHMDGILEGYLQLISLNIKEPQDGLKLRTHAETKELLPNTYTGVSATFCHLAWHLQSNDPSQVPMFADLMQKSPLCASTTHVVDDFYSLVRMAEQYDWGNHTFAATTPRSKRQGPVPPTAVVFHETRCGSTLVANLLAASMGPQEDHVRVYSESPPPVTAILACENVVGSSSRCSSGSHDRLIQDVFYMMGRTVREVQPQYVYYKIQSVGVTSIQAFTRAMPQTPWMFVYRDSIEVIMSHYKNYLTAAGNAGAAVPKDFRPVCLRNYGKPESRLPPLMLEIVQQRGGTTRISDLTQEEFCAAHLATLCESAIVGYERQKELQQLQLQQQQLQLQNKRLWWFVNYKDLPYVLWESVVPSLLGHKTPPETLAAMQAVATKYSKGRGPKANLQWHEDATLKQGMAPDHIKAAVAKYLAPSFERLEELRATLEQHPQ